VDGSEDSLRAAEWAGTVIRTALVPASDRSSTRSSITPTARSRSSRTQP